MTESHVPSRGIYKQLLSQWEGSSLQYVGFYSNNWGPNLAPDRAMTATEQIGFAQQPVQALITTTQNTPLPRGQWPKTKLAYISKTVLIPKLLNPHSLHKDTPTHKQPSRPSR